MVLVVKSMYLMTSPDWDLASLKDGSDNEASLKDDKVIHGMDNRILCNYVLCRNEGKEKRGSKGECGDAIEISV